MANPKSKTRPLTLEHLRTLVKYLNTENDLRAIRNRSLLLVGIIGAMRRSELAAINIEDLTWASNGIVLSIPRSKTDPHGEGQNCFLPYSLRDESLCPVNAVRAWIERGKLNTGPLFRGINHYENLDNKALRPSSVNRIIKQLSVACGIEGGIFLVDTVYEGDWHWKRHEPVLPWIPLCDKVVGAISPQP